MRLGMLPLMLVVHKRAAVAFSGNPMKIRSYSYRRGRSCLQSPDTEKRQGDSTCDQDTINRLLLQRCCS
jgi:hypothetical protein